MALSWDMTAVADYENIDPALREAGIWATVGVGIPVLTADKVGEFYKRVGFWERINGAYRMNDKGEDVRFTRTDVERLVGLRTNASIHTKAQFIRKTWDAHERWNQ